MSRYREGGDVACHVTAGRGRGVSRYRGQGHVDALLEPPPQRLVEVPRLPPRHVRGHGGLKVFNNFYSFLGPQINSRGASSRSHGCLRDSNINFSL